MCALWDSKHIEQYIFHFQDVNDINSVINNDCLTLDYFESLNFSTTSVNLLDGMDEQSNKQID